MLPPKDTEQARELVNIISAYYRKSKDQMVEDDKYYEGDLEDLIEVPEGFDVSIPTTARAIIDEAVDNIEPYDIQIVYPARGFGEQSQKDAEAISRFLKSVWVYWRQSNSDIDILRDFIKNLFKNGKAVFKIVPEWTLWPSLSDTEEAKLIEEFGAEEGKKKLVNKAQIIKNLRTQNFPLVCRSISGKHIMEDPSMDSRKLWCIEEYTISIMEIRNKFTEFYDYFQQMIDVNFTVKELWTATWVDWNGDFHEGKHWIFINDAVVNGEGPVGLKTGEDNPYHNIPYVIKHSGLGIETYDGKPEKKAVGFFTKQVKSQLKAEMRRVTAFDALMQQLAFPLVLLPEQLEDFDFDLSPGGINYIPEDLMLMSEKIFLSAKLPDAEYLQSISMIQNQIERGTTQRAIRGAGVPGTDSAAQLGMITAQAKLRLEPIKKACEEAVDMVNAMILFYIEEIFAQPVSIWAAEKMGDPQYTLKPSVIKGRYRTKTMFMPNEEQTKERKLALATDAMAKAKLNPYDALTMAGYENAMEIIARNLAYGLMEEPAIKRALSKKALEDWGLDTKELILEDVADENMLQQMIAQFQQRMQGQGQPGAPLMGEGGGNGMQPQQPPQAAPQAIGAPVQQVQQQPGTQDMNRQIGGLG